MTSERQRIDHHQIISQNWITMAITPSQSPPFLVIKQPCKQDAQRMSRVHHHQQKEEWALPVH